MVHRQSETGKPRCDISNIAAGDLTTLMLRVSQVLTAANQGAAAVAFWNRAYPKRSFVLALKIAREYVEVIG